MKTVTIGEFKNNLSAYAVQIQKGEGLIVTHGRRKKKIFRVLPIVKAKPKKRKLGALNGKVKVKFSKDFKITTEEFLGE
jgi:antitoxin (DNA-binding transcriptional repressor) of toxin-antitoxin stability system